MARKATGLKKTDEIIKLVQTPDGMLNPDLRSFADRRHRVIQQIAAAREDLKALESEIRTAGFDPLYLERAIKIANNRDRAEAEIQKVNRYLVALGHQQLELL